MVARKFSFSKFHVDSNLMYLIQNVTGQSTEQILGYFYGIANGVAETYLTKKVVASRVNKQLEWHYQGFDAIPYKMVVYSGYTGRYNQGEDRVIQLQATVNFPKSTASVDVTAMVDSIVEASIGLEGSQPMAPFPKPKTKVPVGFKKIIHE